MRAPTPVPPRDAALAARRVAIGFSRNYLSIMAQVGLGVIVRAEAGTGRPYTDAEYARLDLVLGALSVTATLQRPKTGLVLKGNPKTRTSRRRIVLAPQVITALREHRTTQLAERMRAGEAWQDHDYVFCNEIGGAYHHTNLDRYQFKPLIRRSGVPVIRFHDLRHTAATALLVQGVNPKVVSEMLGHASIAITLDLYSHVLPSMQQDAAAAMAVALWG